MCVAGSAYLGRSGLWNEMETGQILKSRGAGLYPADSRKPLDGFRIKIVACSLFLKISVLAL